MSWMSSGHRPQRCPLTNMSMPERRRQVAILRQALRRAVIDPKGENAAITARPRLFAKVTQRIHVLNPWNELGEVFRAAGIDIRERKEQVTALFRASDNGQAFKAALEESGYILAKGDRRSEKRPERGQRGLKSRSGYSRPEKAPEPASAPRNPEIDRLAAAIAARQAQEVKKSNKITQNSFDFCTQKGYF